MSPQPILSRRSVLAVTASGAGALALAACSSSSSSNSPLQTTSAPASEDTSSPAPASTSTSAPAASGGSSSSSPANAIAKLDSIKVGGSTITKINGAPCAIARPDASTVVAFSAICTHMGCTVNAAGAQLDCPCHGSKFNAFTGAVINGPASRALATVSVTVSGDDIVAG